MAAHHQIAAVAPPYLRRVAQLPGLEQNLVDGIASEVVALERSSQDVAIVHRGRARHPAADIEHKRCAAAGGEGGEHGVLGEEESGSGELLKCDLRELGGSGEGGVRVGGG